MKYLIPILLLSGCASFAPPSNLTADQLKAIASDKNFTAVCTNIVGPSGNGKFVYVNIDKSVVANGAITVDPNCVITMSNETKHVDKVPVPTPTTPSTPSVPITGPR
jgi:hypothetical protein